MTSTGGRPARTEPLSRRRIVDEAVRVLDEGGEQQLTFRVLTQRLATGPGTIYWHVENKAELVAAATGSVVEQALDAGSGPDAPADPRERVRAAALGLYDAVAAHPWLASQLAAHVSRSAWGSITPRLFDRFGQQVRALGAPEQEWFTATSVLVHYVLGALGQNATNDEVLQGGVDRDAFLDAAATSWASLDPAEFPLAGALAAQLRVHDDREQFLAGLDIIVAGIAARSRTGGPVSGGRPPRGPRARS